MKATLRALLFAAVFCGTVPGITLESSVLELGDDLFRIEYEIRAATILKNYELEIRFQPSVFRQLSDPSAPPGFDVLLFQPDDPPGAAGRFSALALHDAPVLTGFGVTVRTQECCAPGLHEFAVNLLDERGVLIGTIAEGQTGIPEPATLALVGAALLLVCAMPARYRRRNISR